MLKIYILRIQLLSDLIVCINNGYLLELFMYISYRLFTRLFIDDIV